MNKYETVMIFSPDSSKEEMEKVLEKVRGTITEKGEILDVIEWGKKRFAYPINKRHEGFYFLITFNASVEIPKEIARISRVTESVYRSRTFLRDDTVTAAPQRRVRPKPVEEVKPVEVSKPVEDAKPVETTEKAETPEVVEAVSVEAVETVVVDAVEKPEVVEVVEANTEVVEANTEVVEKVVEEVTETVTNETSEQPVVKEEAVEVNQEEENVK